MRKRRDQKRGDSYVRLLQALAAKELGAGPKQKPPPKKTAPPTTAESGVKVLETPEELVAALVEIKGFRGLVAALMAARCWNHELLRDQKTQELLGEETILKVGQVWPKQFSTEELKDFLRRQAEIGEMNSLWPGQTKILDSLLTVIQEVFGSPKAKDLLATAEWRWRLKNPHERLHWRRLLILDARLKSSLLGNPALRADIEVLLKLPPEEETPRHYEDNLVFLPGVAGPA